MIEKLVKMVDFRSKDSVFIDIFGMPESINYYERDRRGFCWG
jgi:hypothetical protein